MKCGSNYDPEKLEQFRQSLIHVFTYEFLEHWYPDKPYKDAFFRTIRLYRHRIHPLILKAVDQCNIDKKYLNALSYHELILWIDPYEVSYLCKNNSDVVTLYEYNENMLQPWSPSSSNCCREWPVCPSYLQMYS